MNLVKFAVVFFITSCLSLPSSLYAAQCSAVFPDGIATHGDTVSNSKITFGFDARLVNNPDTELSTQQVNANVNSTFASCTTRYCTAASVSAEAVSVNFRQGGGSVNFNPPGGQTTTFGTTSVNNYDQVSANTNATLNFSDNHDVYFFERLAVGPDSRLNFLAGKTYYIRNFSVNSRTRINVTGAGTAKVFIASAVNFTSPVLVNSNGVNQSGDVRKLVMHVGGNVTFGNGSTFSGVLYAKDLSFISASYLFGVASGEVVKLDSDSIITYDNRVFDADLGGLCSRTQPAIIIANFQFDECAYSGRGNEVLDQLGSYSGTSHNSLNTSFDAQIEKALGISSAQHHVQVNIPLPTTYSVSTWFKKPNDNSGSRYFILGAMETGGDLLLLDRALNMRWAVYTPSQGNVYGAYSFANLDANWHHMALIYQENKTSLFIDGDFVESVNLAPSGTLKYIATSFDGVGGPNPQGFRAPLDEFMVFDGVLTDNEISTIYNNQSAKKNYDGSTRDKVNCASAIANFQFDECAYTGNGNEVIDQFDNYSGTSENGVSTALAGQIENSLDILSAQNHVQVAIALPNEYSVSTWFKKPTDNSGSRYFVLGAMQNGGDLLYLDRNRGWRWGVYDAGSERSINGNYSFNNLDSNWHHMVLVYKNNQSSLYIDGNFVETLNLAASGTLKYIGTSFDGVTSANPQGFRAQLDEFMVFDGALTASEITVIYNNQNSVKNYDGSARQSTNCPLIDHYEIVHDGNGLTCAPESITIKACSNASCTITVSDASDVKLSINGSEIKTVTVVGGSISTNFSFPNLLPTSTATLSLDKTFQCKNGTSTSCDIIFADAGFRFLYDTDLNENIAYQTSGVAFAKALKLQAVRKNTASGECEGIFNGSVNVKLAQENLPTIETDINPGLTFQVNGDPIAKFSEGSTSVSLEFSIDSIATIPNPVYLDAGKIRLQASYSNSAFSLEGSSNEFWVKPDKFVIESLASYNATADSTYVAGKDFTFHVSALNANGDITQNYRQSDGVLKLKVTRVVPTLADTVNGQFTYLDNTSIESDTGFQPVVLTNFSDGDKGQSVFNGGRYNEVGVINVELQDSNYGGLSGSQGLVSADNLTLGRFTPAYFKQTVNTAGRLDAYHSDADSGRCEIANWTYTGQRTTDNKGTIGYSLAPKIAITAFNAQDEITQNYTLGAAEGFMRLLATGVDISWPDHDDEQLRVNDEALSADENAKNFVEITAFMETGKLEFSVNDEGALVAGQMLYTFSDNDHFSYDRDETSFLKPFSAKIPFVPQQITDQDGVTLQINLANNEIAEAAIEKLVSTGVDIRFARMVLANAYGSENTGLRVPLSIEVYNGTNGKYDSENFAINSNESCLTASVEDKKSGTKYSGNMNIWDYRLIDIETDNIQVADTEASVSGVFIEGEQKQLFFSSPTKQGVLDFEYQMPAWLQFDWRNEDGKNDGPFDANPSATLSFGLYRGNDRIISWREVAN